MSITKGAQSFLGFLEQIGSADGIAEYLESRGVKGKRKDQLECPLARAFSDFCPEDDTDFHIRMSPAWMYESSFMQTTKVPEGSVEIVGHVAEFVRRFDNGDYPKLEEQ